MADNPSEKPAADFRAEMAMLKATAAPLVFFELASTHGTRNGVGNITLEVGMHVTFDGRILNEHRVVAHLRFPLSAIRSIRAALDGIELLAKPPASEEKN